jgi:proline dehydrogenase
MLHSFLMYLSRAAWAQNMVTEWTFASRAASRFVAGQTIDDALRVVMVLNKKEINATLDHLGEHTTTAAEANRATDGILAVLDEIQKVQVCSNVSIKLTQIGMSLDDNICRANLIRILERAKSYNNFIRIDIEDSRYVDKTISFYNEMIHQGFTGETLGMAVQSYLYRTEKDVQRLVEHGARLRLVKGAYQEPPQVAFHRKADVDANYDLVVSILVDTSLKYKT